MPKREKSILFIDQYSMMGGGQTVLLAMIESCLDSSWSVSLLAPGGGNLEAVVCSRFGDRVQFLPMREMKLSIGRKTLGDIFRLTIGSASVFAKSRLIARHSVVHVNGARLFPAIGVLSLFLRPKFFYHIHLDHAAAEKRLVAWLTRRRRTAGIFVNSKFVLERLLKTGKIRSRKLILLRFGLSKSLSSRSFRNRFSSSKSSSEAVVIGRLSQDKGQHIVASLAKKVSAIRFYLIGETDFQDPKYGDRLKRESPSNVVFKGRSEDLAKTLDDLESGISIVPSQWEEPFGLVAVESMALSFLTLTSGRGGLAEIAQESGSITFNSESQLEVELESISQMPLDELALRAKSQFDRAQEVFGWRAFSEAYQISLSEIQ